MKMHFSFILLLALSTIVNLHVKLRRADMVVEDHEETLMEVMVFCKLRPATLEIHLAVPIIPDLYFIGSSSPRVFVKNCFSQLSPINEIGKLQWYPLNLTALSVGDAEKGVYPGRRRRRSITWWSAWTWSSSRHLGLVPASQRAARALLNRSRWRGCYSRVLEFIFTTTRAATASLFHRRIDV
jgi:hypothetical protein